jgi:hypothetical protein
MDKCDHFIKTGSGQTYGKALRTLPFPQAIGGDPGRVWAFLLAEHALLLLKVVLQALIADVPQDVTEQALAARYRYAKATARGGAAEAAEKRAVLRKNVQKDRRRRADGEEEFPFLEEEEMIWRQFKSTTKRKEGEEESADESAEEEAEEEGEDGGEDGDAGGSADAAGEGGGEAAP